MLVVETSKSGPERKMDKSMDQNIRKASINEEPKTHVTKVSGSEGPSRLDCDLLNNEISKIYIPFFGNTTKKMEYEKENITIKQELIHDEEKKMKCNQLGDEMENIKKRVGSPNEAPKIKRERLEDDEDLPDENHVFVKNEMHEEVEIEFENHVFIKNEMHEEVEIKFEAENSSVEGEMSNRFTYYKRTSLGVDHKCEVNSQYWIPRRSCNLCEIFIEDEMDEHLNNHHKIGIFFDCPFCESGQEFSKKKFYTESRKHSEQRSVDCQFCGEKFRNWLTEKDHIDQEHQDKVGRICSICGFEASSYRFLLNHLLHCHNGESLIHNCQVCGFSTLSSSLLHLHMEAKHPPLLHCHNGETLIHNCQVCDFSTLSSSLLQVHMEAKHPPLPKETQQKNVPVKKVLRKLERKCPCCDFVEKNKYMTLKRHSKLEHKE